MAPFMGVNFWINLSKSENLGQFGVWRQSQIRKMNLLIFFSLIILILSVIIHEYMHGWMANELGDPTAKNAGRLTLNPMVHVDPWGSVILPLMLFLSTGFIFGYAKPVPFNPFNLRDSKYGPAKVAAAGPLANLIMAVSFGLILRFFPVDNLMLIRFLQIIIQINLVLMIINLLPIPPLDGSRIIFPFLPRGIQEVYFKMEQYGMVLVILILILAFPFLSYVINFLYWLIVGF